MSEMGTVKTILGKMLSLRDLPIFGFFGFGTENSLGSVEYITHR